MSEAGYVARLVVVLALGLAATACDVGGEPEATVPVESDRPAPGGPVTRGCGSHYANDFDAGVESRIVTAGPVSLLAFRVSSSVPDPSSSVRMFKLAVRIAAGSEATLRTGTAGTALVYDRAKFKDDNAYQLTDGDAGVRFVGCPDRSVVFNGAILTTGPHTVGLTVSAAAKEIPVTVTAYTG